MLSGPRRAQAGSHLPKKMGATKTLKCKFLLLLLILLLILFIILILIIILIVIGRAKVLEWKRPIEHIPLWDLLFSASPLDFPPRFPYSAAR